MSLASKHLAKLPEDWTQLFLEMYNQGCSDTELMKEFGITPKAWKIMLIALGESEFHEVVDFGHALAQAWWEFQGRTNLKTRGFNVRLYDINMQNRWGWARKSELSDTDSQIGAADDKALDRRIKELSKKVSGGVEA